MCLSCLYFPFPCVYREEDTPSSIPNLAVKLLFADDTALCKCGNVGRCRDWGNVFMLLLYYFILLVNPVSTCFYLYLSYLACLIFIYLTSACLILFYLTLYSILFYFILFYFILFVLLHIDYRKRLVYKILLVRLA